MSRGPVRLAPLSGQDHEALREFEWRNRAFFETHINARPASFYSDEGLSQAVAAHLADAAADRAYAFLVWDEADRLMGRVNLSQVRRAHFHSAELGYRVAEAATGQGIASEAVRLVLRHARETLGLVRIEAVAHVENHASAAVLSRNGFRVFGRSRRSLELHGRWLDKLHFERDLRNEA